MYVVELLFNRLHECSLQPTADLKTPLQIFVLKSSERKEFSEISKIPKKYLQKSSCSLTLQACNPELLTSVKKDPKKNVFFECSEIVWHKRVYNKSFD